MSKVTDNRGKLSKSDHEPGVGSSENTDQILIEPGKTSDLSMDDKHKNNAENRLVIMFRGRDGIKVEVALADGEQEAVKAAFRSCGWSIYSDAESESFAREIEALIDTQIDLRANMRFRSPDKKQVIVFTTDNPDEVRQSFTEHGWKEEELAELAS